MGTTRATMSAALGPLRLEKRKLRRVLRLADLYFFSVCAMLTFETLGQVSIAGGQALTWIVVCGLTFYLPYALLVAELGAALPVEGGLYAWVCLLRWKARELTLPGSAHDRVACS